jgi:hypothetical protein
MGSAGFEETGELPTPCPALRAIFVPTIPPAIIKTAAAPSFSFVMSIPWVVVWIIANAPGAIIPVIAWPSPRLAAALAVDTVKT